MTTELPFGLTARGYPELSSAIIDDYGRKAKGIVWLLATNGLVISDEEGRDAAQAACDYLDGIIREAERLQGLIDGLPDEPSPDLAGIQDFAGQPQD